MSNSSNPCIHSPSFFDQVWNANYFVSNIVTPVYFILAGSGNCILFLAFLSQPKVQRTYMYQIYTAGAQTAEAVFLSLHYLGTQIFLYGQGIRWHSFQATLSRCYVCSWWSCHLGPVLANSLTTLSLLLATTMAADRVLALLKPLLYKNLNHAKNQWIVLISCIIISFTTSAFDTMRLYPAPREDATYASTTDTDYMSLPLVKALALLRVFLQGAAAAALAILSAALCYLYRTRFVNLKVKITNSTAEQKKTKDDERALLLITLIECSLTIASTSVLLAYYTFAYCYPIDFSCWQQILVPINGGSRMLIDIWNFYLVLGMSKKVRGMVKKMLRSWFKKDGQTTNVISVGSQNWPAQN